MLRWAMLLCATLLSACATAPPAAPPLPLAALLHDDAFTAPAQRIDPGALFQLSDAMRQHLASVPKHPLDGTDPRRLLIDLLYRKRSLALEYDASTTRTAAGTFEARAGNCLSLVIMTAAFAKEMGLPLRYRSVDVEESWSRGGGVLFASGHVNLALQWPQAKGRVERNFDGPMVVDFLPADETRNLVTHDIEESTVVAMFMNNRAAEAVARGALDEAYWYAREAVQQDSHFYSAYNTLGVIYMRQGQPQWALPVLQALLEREPHNAKVMGNLVMALNAAGRAAEADVLAARLASIEPYPPYHFFRAGLLAMQQHEYRVARELFRKEVQRQAFNAEVHFWLARAAQSLGNSREAAKHLELARQNSNTPAEQAIYAAKLDWLRAHQSSQERQGATAQ